MEQRQTATRDGRLWTGWIVAMIVIAWLLGGMLVGPLGAQVDDQPPADATSGTSATETSEAIPDAAPDVPAPTGLEHLGAPTTLGNADHGALLIRTTARGVYLPAPLVDTEVDLTVRGMVAEADVRQRFTNPTDQWVEGVYVFPLPENAAVDRLRLTIGDRVIEGEIHERQAARQVYEQAREQGQRAALVEQQRPNLFSTEIANLGPHETVEVRIGFRQEVRFDDGTFSLRFPMAITPRFEPENTPPSPVELAGGPATALPVQVAAHDAAPPRVAVGTTSAPRAADVRLRVDLDPGIPVARLGSRSHAVRTLRHDDAFMIELEDGAVPRDRDFVLEWQPAASATPHMAIVSEQFRDPRGGLDTYGLLMVIPPAQDPATSVASAHRPPRETVFVIDVSGSMSGPSIRQAKAALDDALARLRPIDHFNVISFAQDVVALGPESVPATPDRIDKARQWVRGLGIRGGTYMLPALQAALRTDGIDRGLRQVIFMTDGAVGNEDQLFGVIDSDLGESRLFTVGIGSAPNSHFMRTAARFGRGTFMHIASVDEVASRMASLYTKLERPMLMDLELIWDDPNVEAWPARVGDLYAGEPLVVAARLPGGRTGLTIRGMRDGVLESFQVEHGAPSRLGEGTPAAVARLWARRKVADLRDALVRGGQDDSLRAGLREAILDVALDHHLVTDFTSLVAVDRTPAAPADADPARVAVPLPLPEGWRDHPGFTNLPATATGFKLWLIAASLLAAMAAMTRRRAHPARRTRPSLESP